MDSFLRVYTRFWELFESTLLSPTPALISALLPFFSPFSLAGGDVHQWGPLPKGVVLEFLRWWWSWRCWGMKLCSSPLMMVVNARSPWGSLQIVERLAVALEEKERVRGIGFHGDYKERDFFCPQLQKYKKAFVVHIFFDGNFEYSLIFSLAS